MDYANGKDDGGAAALCAVRGPRILCAEPGSKTHQMGGQIVSVDHELITFGRDRLGDFKILDVGCGGGRTIEKLAAHT